jgi:hypothetical protein
MKITYKLYSEFEPEGKTLATIHDMSHANLLEPYYRQIYSTMQFKVTVKYHRQKEQYLTGGWN